MVCFRNGVVAGDMTGHMLHDVAQSFAFTWFSHLFSVLEPLWEPFLHAVFSEAFSCDAVL